MAGQDWQYSRGGSLIFKQGLRNFSAMKVSWWLPAIAILVCPPVMAVGMPATESVPANYTQTDVILLVTYVLLALVFSFLCSVAEAVLLSITPSFIAGLKEKRPRQAALIRKLKQENVDRSLAAILTLNTVAHTVGAIGSGAKATAVFGSAWFGLFSAVMTLMILFLSEIIPKTLGAVYWRNLAGVTAQFVRALIYALYPLILVTEQLTRLVAGGKQVHAFNRDEFVAMADIGKQSGHINERESKIIRNLFRFESLSVRDIMTPRTVIVAFPESMSIAEALSTETVSPFSRLPVYVDSIDHITGFVMKDDLLLSVAEGGQDSPLSAFKRELVSVEADMSLSDVLERLLNQRQQIALVTGEFGGTQGLVTMEDVVETLLGAEIVDEMDQIEDMQGWARGLWERRARAQGLNVDIIKEIKES